MQDDEDGLLSHRNAGRSVLFLDFETIIMDSAITAPDNPVDIQSVSLRNVANSNDIVNAPVTAMQFNVQGRFLPDIC